MRSARGEREREDREPDHDAADPTRVFAAVAELFAPYSGLAMACPDETSLSEFIARALPVTAAARIEAHLADCADCRNLVFALASSAADGGASGAVAERIGRFEVIDVIGRGAMGVVYRARDPELGRLVAIKVRQARARLDVEGEDRLRREAQALARLAHPNVVAVYESGRAGQVAYVAMELVEGPTLEAWLDAKPSPVEIVRVLVAAGRGLAAAHAAGLVHRDFKPHNVFVAKGDGTPKVGDFGLVRAERDGAAPAAPSELMMTLSISGSIIGTPAYMSPEQLRGEPATEASDQFSFCVTLFEALFGKRPFVAKTVAELESAMQQPLAIPRTTAAVRRVLRRGLDPDPGRRFPGMAALLDQLERPSRALRWATLAAAAGMLALAAFTLAPRTVDPCERADPEAERVLSPVRLPVVAHALLATGAPGAGDTAERVEAALATYGQRWRTASETSCRATVENRQSAKLGDLQRACLERRLRQTDELVDVLVAVNDPAAVPQALTTVLGLPDVDACTRADPALLGDVDPPPPAQAEAVERVERTLDRIESLNKTGQVRVAADGIDGAVAQARALHYAPLLARALLVEAAVYTAASKVDQLEAILDEAARVAASARDDRAAAEAWTRRVHVVGVEGGRYADAHQWARAADAAVLRAGNPPDLRSALQMNVGSLLIEEGKLDEARQQLDAALHLREQAMPDAKLLIADVHNNLGALLQREGKWDEAQQQFEQTLALDRAVEGDDHPDVFETYVNLGYLFTEREMPDKALEMLEKARAIGEKVLGPDHVNVGIAIDTIGLAKMSLGKYDEALALHRQAYAIMLAKLGPKHPRTGYAIGNVARALQRLGDYAGATKAYQQSVTILSDALGPTHDLVGRVEGGLAIVEALNGDAAGAKRDTLASLAIFDKNGHGDSDDASESRINLAQLALRSGDVIEARAGYTRAYDALLKSQGPSSPDTLVAEAGVVYCDAMQRRVTRASLDALERGLATAKASDFEPHVQTFIAEARTHAHAALGER
jgi:tetratricopeptide (TPR) repeat protein/tRNA A-37 threonylcarbamoyl transferase component Bud32